MNGRRMGPLGWILAIVAIAVIVGVLAFDAGLVTGRGEPPAVGRGPVGLAPFAVRRIGERGIGFGLGGGLLGLLVVGLLVAAIVALLISLAGRRPGAGPSAGNLPPEVRSSFEAWHREAHGVPHAASRTTPSPTPSSPTPSPPQPGTPPSPGPPETSSSPESPGPA